MSGMIALTISLLKIDRNIVVHHIGETYLMRLHLHAGITL